MNLRKHLGAALLILTGGLAIGTAAQAHSVRLYDRDDYCPVHRHEHYGQHSPGRHFKSVWEQLKHHRHEHGDRDRHYSYWQDRDDHHSHRRDRDDRHHDSNYRDRDGQHEYSSRKSGISYTDRR